MMLQIELEKKMKLLEVDAAGVPMKLHSRRRQNLTNWLKSLCLSCLID